MIFFEIILLFLFFVSTVSSVFAQTVINEVVTNSSKEWVEIYNSSDSAQYLTEYYIDDDVSFDSDQGSSTKKKLTNLNLSNLTYPYVELSSIFNNDGDYVVLFDSGGNIIDQYQYTKNFGLDVSIGRFPDKSGDFFVLQSSTKGDANSDPVPTVTPTNTPTVVPTPTPTLVPTSSPTNTISPSNTPKPTSTPKPTPTTKPSPTLKPSNTPKPIPTEEILPTLATPTGTVLGETTENKYSGLLRWIGLIFGAVGSIMIATAASQIWQRSDTIPPV